MKRILSKKRPRKEARFNGRQHRLCLLFLFCTFIIYLAMRFYQTLHLMTKKRIEKYEFYTHTPPHRRKCWPEILRQDASLNASVSIVTWSSFETSGNEQEVDSSVLHAYGNLRFAALRALQHKNAPVLLRAGVDGQRLPAFRRFVLSRPPEELCLLFFHDLNTLIAATPSAIRNRYTAIKERNALPDLVIWTRNSGLEENDVLLGQAASLSFLLFDAYKIKRESWGQLKDSAVLDRLLSRQESHEGEMSMPYTIWQDSEESLIRSAECCPFNKEKLLKHSGLVISIKGMEHGCRKRQKASAFRKGSTNIHCSNGIKAYHEMINWLHLSWFQSINGKKESYLDSGHAKQPSQLQHPRVVVSLTTTPSRITLLQPTLISLLEQKPRAPSRIVLNVPLYSKRFERAYDIPPYLYLPPFAPSTFVNRCAKDLGPATKLLPTLTLEQDPRTLIITVDDEYQYPSSLIQVLVEHHLRAPHAAYGFAGQMIDVQFSASNSVRRSKNELEREQIDIGRTGNNKGGLGWRPWRLRVRSADIEPYAQSATAVDILEAFLGAIYSRSFFPANASLFPVPPPECFTADDIWFAAFLASKGIPRIKLPMPFPRPRDTPTNNISPLRSKNIGEESNNDRCARSVLPALHETLVPVGDLAQPCAVRLEMPMLP